jgi:hypothetical protein
MASYYITPVPKTKDGMTIQPAPLESGTLPPTGGGPTGAPQQPGLPSGGSNPLDAVGGLLDSSVFGIPVKWVLIGAAAYFLLKR